MLLLLNEHGDPSVLFPNLSSYNINNQLAKFDKNLRVDFNGMTLGMCVFELQTATEHELFSILTYPYTSILHCQGMNGIKI